jgi:hypothetical protein
MLTRRIFVVPGSVMPEEMPIRSATILVGRDVVAPEHGVGEALKSDTLTDSRRWVGGGPDPERLCLLVQAKELCSQVIIPLARPPQIYAI